MQNSNKINSSLLNLILAITILTVVVSCNKKAGGITGSDPTRTEPSALPPPHIQVTEYPVDLLFSNVADCKLNTETSNGPEYGNLTYFTLSATLSNVEDTIPELKILIQQTFHKPTNTYHNPEIYVYEQTLSNSFKLITIPSNFNFVTLPYNNGPASFFGTATVTEGKGKYINIRKTNLKFSGFADTTNHTGSIRLQGSIFF